MTGVDTAELARQSDAYYYNAELEIPSTYNDGVHGSASVVAIGAYAFSGVTLPCNAIVIPSSIKEIGSYAFSGLSGSISGGSGIDTLDRYAFMGSSYLPNQIRTGTWQYYDYEGYGTGYSFTLTNMLSTLKSSPYNAYKWEKHS